MPRCEDCGLHHADGICDEVFAPSPGGVDRVVVALLGPRHGATCTAPACGYPDPCPDCEHRRFLADLVAEGLDEFAR